MPPKKPAAKAAPKPAAKGKTTTATKSTTTTTKSTTTKADTSKAKEAAAVDEKEPEVTVIKIKQLASAIKDPDGKMKAAKKWPLLIDKTENAGTFLRYTNSNYMQAISQKDMAPETLRKALIGAIRYGKALVVDMMDFDGFEILLTSLEEMEKGLTDKLMNRSIMDNESYMSLVTDDDGDEYKDYMFSDDLKDSFVFLILTIKDPPNMLMMRKMYPMRIEN
ncbi:IQ motif and ankyrin repeat domain-containing protein 1-like [Gigantopelta aegis]|uniref:IQ motif and ankyrin repeat domain-containing protein 1-like n=1 Tax=Gigantopelta aegis TaxID=1735272 RepID=UPI001B88C0C7|nr:IQ motif and ankyrin repeat domain-containing protein 1-like [Gigantopelta aegis]XP_041359306.1 IQ motif and ankyrin repeat domain-containing protein 1-like [Gigantopelta aegis]